MAEQIDKIIIKFELHGAAQAQTILVTMNRVLEQIYGTAGKSAKSVSAFGSATGFASKNIQVMGNMTSDTILKVSEFAVVIFAVVGAYRALLAPLVDVEHNMGIVKAVSHATAEELDALQKEALRLGTIFPGGAKKATQALVAIGQAGYNTVQSLELLEPVFRLATIGEVDFERAIKLVIPTLNAFNFSTAESARVVDVLASSISGTLTEVETFEIALPKLSNLANELNISFRDLVGLIGYLTQVGLPASKVYTAITAVFTQLEKNSLTLKGALKGTGLEAKQLDIESQGLRNVLQTVADAGLSAAEKMELLGIRGFVAGSVLEQDFNAALDDMVAALDTSGEALFQAGVMTETLKAKFGQLGGTLQETLESMFGPLIDSIKIGVDQIKSFIKALSGMSPVGKEWTRRLLSIALGLMALGIWLKATKLLLIDFIWTRGIWAGIQIIPTFVAGLHSAAKAFREVGVKALFAGASAKAFWGSVLGPIAAVAAIVGSIAWIKHEMKEFRESLEGQIHETQAGIESTRLQVQELNSLKSRLTDSAKAYTELTKEGKDARKALAEFYSVLLDIIDKYPEASSMILAMAQDFGNVELAVWGVEGAVDTLTARLQGLMDYMDQLAKLEFQKELLGLAPTLIEPKVVPYQQSKVIAGWLQEFLQDRAPLPYTEAGIHQLDGGIPFRLPGYQPQYDTMDMVVKALGEMSVENLKEFANQLLLHPPADVDVKEWAARVLRVNEKITKKQIAELMADLDVEDVTTTGGGGRDDKAGKYKVPGMKAFSQLIAFQRAQDSLTLKLTEYDRLTASRKLDRVAELNIERELLGFQKSNADALIVSHMNRIAELETHKETLTLAEDRIKADEEIFSLQTAILKHRGQIADIDTKLFKNGEKLLNEVWKPISESIESVVNNIKEALTRAESFSDVLDELAREQYLDKLFTITFPEDVGDPEYLRGLTLERVEHSISIIEGKIRTLVEYRDELLEDIEDKGFFSRQLWKALIAYIETVISKLTKLREGFVDIVTDDEERLKTKLREVRDEFKQGIEDALSSAFMSDNVKDAVRGFMNFFRKIAADFLAKYLMQRMMSMFGTQSAGQTPPGGAAGAAAGIPVAGVGTAGAGAFPWIAMAMVAAPMLGQLFGGSGGAFDKLNTKLEYILRGGGYQLPPSFVIPEDEGEFSYRRRGRDSLAIRFPKRQIEILVRNQIEISPSELMRVTASQISVGGMGGAQQFSLLTG